MPTTYHSASKGTIQRVVDCEWCGCQFEYTLMRQGIVPAPSWSEEDDTDAAVEARQQAHLDWTYGNEHDPVPCPECKRYQTAMRPAVQRYYYGRQKILGLGPTESLLFLAGVMPALGLLFMGGGPQAAYPLWPIGVAAALLLVAALAYVVQSALAGRYDPERDPRGPADRGVVVRSGRAGPGG